MDANENYAKWCVDRLKQNEELRNTFFPELAHYPWVLTKDIYYDEDEREINCTEDIGDDN